LGDHGTSSITGEKGKGAAFKKRTITSGNKNKAKFALPPGRERRTSYSGETSSWARLTTAQDNVQSSRKKPPPSRKGKKEEPWEISLVQSLPIPPHLFGVNNPAKKPFDRVVGREEWVREIRKKRLSGRNSFNL